MHDSIHYHQSLWEHLLSKALLGPECIFNLLDFWQTKWISFIFHGWTVFHWASLVAQVVKNLLAIQETSVQTFLCLIWFFKTRWLAVLCSFLLPCDFFFHDLSATEVPSDACSISLKEGGRTNLPFVPSFCVSCICFIWSYTFKASNVLWDFIF